MEITANAVQLVNYNQNVLFTETPIAGNKCIIHRDGSGLVSLRGLTNQCFARFQIFFSGNVAIPTGGTVLPINIAIAINGEPVSSSIMISTPAAVDEYGNVSSSIFIDVPKGAYTQVSIKNIGESEINVTNANLIVTRVA